MKLIGTYAKMCHIKPNGRLTEYIAHFTVEVLGKLSKNGIQ